MKSKTAWYLLLVVLLFTASFASANHRESFYTEKCKDRCLDLPHSEERTRQRCEERCEKEEGNKQKKNPLVFGLESFLDRVRSEHGRVSSLKNFYKLSPLLLGIANYHLAILEVHPLTFVMPTHLDADSVFYVVDGVGAISILHEGGRESHTLRQGDILRVWAGSIIYLINKSKNQKLVIANLLRPVGNPSNVQVFHSAGRDAAESYYRSFSIEIMEAALNTPRYRLLPFLEKHKREVIVKAPEEKIKAMARHSSKSESGTWPFTRTKKPFNLLDKKPTHQNNRGQLFEADGNDYEQLKDVNARISFANITSGSMEAPFFNTRATEISIVVKGSGYVEIICPHVSQKDPGEKGEGYGQEDDEEEMQQKPKYRRVSSVLSVGTVFVSPPGHPTAIVASPEQSVHVLCFEVGAENNEKIFVAGKNNILNEMEEEAKEIAFDVPSRVADEILGAQAAEVFVAGPKKEQEARESEVAATAGRTFDSFLHFAAAF
ncbi:hypothetical protein HPP92_015622 [Vanilla planifolia]|uniref:Cupin type-1 domain-containing protein n=1 Tax=Vanilla planifolia TaxID=51239 RepID=A0A835QI88_VANPL|nr:hypothetical protein HPP92_015622 [Vanilla planifolia]